MANEFQLTNPSMAVYRPWAWIEFPANKILGSIKINYPEGIDSKFRWLRDFSWSYGAGGGNQVSFSIYEDRAYYNELWPSIVKMSINDIESNRLTFQWGYEGRTEQGQPVNYSSGIHYAFIKKMDTEYTSGGIFYNFIAHDSFQSTEQITLRENKMGMTFEQAVQSILDDLHKDRTLPKMTVEFTQEFSDYYKNIHKTLKKEWKTSGTQFLLQLQEWAYSLYTDNNVLKTDFEQKSIKIMIEDNFNISKLIIGISKIDQGTPIEIHVNPPEQGPLGVGKHTAISIRPEISGDKLWSLALNIDSLRIQYDRGVDFNKSQNLDLYKSSGGVPAHVVSPSTDSSVTSKQRINSVYSMSMAGGTTFVSSFIDVELLGIPSLDSFDFLEYDVKLIVWNTSHINEELKWSRTGLLREQDLLLGASNDGLFDARYSGHYKISRVTHSINSEGSYVTTLHLIPKGYKKDDEESTENN